MDRLETFKDNFYRWLLWHITIRDECWLWESKFFQGLFHAISFSKWTDWTWYADLFRMPADLTYTNNNPLINYINVIICRAQYHKAGVYFYNLCGLEPDMHCQGCYDDLG